MTLFSVVTTAVVIGACGGSSEPTETGPGSGADEGVHPGATRLASATLEDGRKIVLRSTGGGSEVGPCLSLVGVDSQVRQCGRAPSERDPPRVGEPVLAEAIAQASRSTPLEVYGATSAVVTRVVLRYELDGHRRRAPAVLMRVSDPTALEEAGINEPFGYFLGELPPQASKVQAVAFDQGAEVLGSAGYEHMRDLHPRAFIAGPP